MVKNINTVCVPELSITCQLLAKFHKIFLQGFISNIYHLFKDVRAQNVPPYRFFFNVPYSKVKINFCQKGKKNGGSLSSFSR